jgi:hypothetical protein
MSEHDAQGRATAANENSRERMTLEAIGINPWNAVDMPLPLEADRTLLERAAFAAAQCGKAAFAAARVAGITQPDWAAAYVRRSIAASDREAQVRHELSAHAPEPMAKVSPFVDPAEVQRKALVNVMIGVAGERGGLAQGRVSAATIDKNPWSIIWSDLSRANAALLDRVRDTAVQLVSAALRYRDERSYTPEEAALWGRYAEAAKNTYIAACALSHAQDRTPSRPAADVSPAEREDERLTRGGDRARSVECGRARYARECEPGIAVADCRDRGRFAPQPRQPGQHGGAGGRCN